MTYDRLLLLAIGGFLASFGSATAAPPDSTRPTEGIRRNTPQVHAITNVRLVVQPGEEVADATIVVRDGLIEAAGAGIAVPEDARVWDATGRTAYAGFIDAYSEVDAPSVSRDKSAAHWNRYVTPQSLAVEGYSPSSKANEDRRKQGFVARLIAPSDGVIKGFSGIVSTGDGDGDRAILQRRVAQHVRLTASRRSNDYPNSPMGAVALARQTMYDARWYRDTQNLFASGATIPRPERNDALQALIPVLEGTAIVADAIDEQYFLRSDAFAKEFELMMIARGSGEEYRRLEAIVATKRPVIVPLDFPKPPDVSTTEAAQDVSLERLMHWDLAPENPGRLADAGVTIALTSHGLNKRSDFWPALRKAVRRGLGRDDALAALTSSAASMFGLERHGKIKPGFAASFVLVDGDPFTNENATFIATWVDGVRYEIEPESPTDLRGDWTLNLAQARDGRQPNELSLSLTGEPEKLKGNVKRGEKKIALKNLTFRDGRLSTRFKADDLDAEGIARLTATVTLDTGQPAALFGSIVWPDESVSPFTATRESKDESHDVPAEPVVARKPDDPEKASFPANFPLGAYGRTASPQQPETIVFLNATVWTCGDAGVIENATVVVREGKIESVGTDDFDLGSPGITGKNRRFVGATIIDCAGKHLTPGLIDCHSHMATDGGVNESAQAVTAEVRIGDFINATDINIYRQLAGGLTTSNILHGSANPIGGQNQVIKLRWGALPEELKFKEAPSGIKFALGENVTQSNWSNPTNRYPQTRMGVEQIIRDRFLAAREYRHRQKQYAETKAGAPPRVDLELEALAEVVEGERLVHCHSYRQDEILALLRTLDEFGVTIGTLQHILEGYKVADEMAKHGAGGSAFSDWWAYKFEVYDAIPFAGAMMHDNGVLVSFNSDDRELARHLNQEAAKATKYGGVPPEEALKFVTLNPAKQLKIDQYVGSIEPGKHADLVVWSHEPLSNFAACEQTWIDGRCYFSRKQSQQQADKIREMRATLIQKVLASGEKSSKSGDDEEESRERDFWPNFDEFCRCQFNR